MKHAKPFLESQMSKRIILADQVPLEKPFSIEIWCCARCNLRCEFCAASTAKFKKNLLDAVPNGIMDFELFKKIIDDIKKSFGRIKQLMVCGNGEPLANPYVVDMISYAHKCGVADRIDLITNGTLLTPDLSDKLINAGLSMLRISINGLSDEDYLKHCGVKVDFEYLVEQIRYFYTHKKQAVVYAKIIDYMVHEPNKREQFFRIFEDICDVISVENLYIAGDDDGVDYQRIDVDFSASKSTKYGKERVKSQICSRPFFTLGILEDGRIFPCYVGPLYENTLCLGNLQTMSIGDIWAKECHLFQRKMLDGVQSIPVCANCTCRESHIYSEDVLDEAAERLKKVYDKKIGKTPD